MCFLIAVFPKLTRLVLYDLDANRAELFQNKVHQQFAQIAEIHIAKDIPTLLSETELVSLATTVGTPYLADISPLPSGSTILNISLRDLTPEILLQCDNVVDDVDHVCSANTSVHLAEQKVNHRDFIRCSLASILLGEQPARKTGTDVSIFSPFGLGILDIASAQLVLKLAKEANKGVTVPSFLPESWLNS